MIKKWILTHICDGNFHWIFHILCSFPFKSKDADVLTSVPKVVVQGPIGIQGAKRPFWGAGQGGYFFNKVVHSQKNHASAVFLMQVCLRFCVNTLVEYLTHALVSHSDCTLLGMHMAFIWWIFKPFLITFPECGRYWHGRNLHPFSSCLFVMQLDGFTPNSHHLSTRGKLKPNFSILIKLHYLIYLLFQ